MWKYAFAPLLLIASAANVRAESVTVIAVSPASLPHYALMLDPERVHTWSHYRPTGAATTFGVPRVTTSTLQPYCFMLNEMIVNCPQETSSIVSTRQ